MTLPEPPESFEPSEPGSPLAGTAPARVQCVVLEDAAACLRLADAYRDGNTDLARDPERALEFREHACRLGRDEACLEVAAELLGGDQERRDPRRAAQVLAWACERHTAAGRVRADPETGAFIGSDACELLRMLGEGEGEGDDTVVFPDEPGGDDFDLGEWPPDE